MILYLCPACKKSCKQNRETCEEFECGQAGWIFDQNCPECSENDQMEMLIQDEFGVCCAVTDCKFKQEYK